MIEINCNYIRDEVTLDFKIQCNQCGSEKCLISIEGAEERGEVGDIKIYCQNCGNEEWAEQTKKHESQVVVKDGGDISIDSGLDAICVLDQKAEYYSSFTFHNPNINDEIGRLTWNDGVLKFEGNAEESAKVFFEYLRQFFQA